MSLFITATGTNVGKTMVSALLMAKYGNIKKLNYWKPVQTGMDIDALKVASLSGHDPGKFVETVYHLGLPASPHYAASVENVQIETEKIQEKFNSTGGNLIVEGAGGLYVPLNDNDFMIDLVRMLDIPALLVVPSVLGTINHSILSIKALQSYGIALAGFFVYGPDNSLRESNIMAVENFTGADCLGFCEVPDGIAVPEKFIPFARNSFDNDSRIGSLL